MKLFKYLILGLLIFTGSVNAVDDDVLDAAKGAALYYNRPTTLLNQNKVLWLANSYRLLKGYDTNNPTANLPATTDIIDFHRELLTRDKTSDDARIKEGSNVFLLQKASDPTATGPVLNGDEIRIIAIYASKGLEERSGAIEKGCIVNVADTSRLGEHKLSKALTHYDVYVSDPSYKKDRPKRAIFTIQSIDGKAGSMLFAKDLITLQNKEYARPLCALPDGRWGNQHGEICAIKMATPDASAQFTIRHLDIDNDLSDAGRANLKAMLTNLIKSSLLTLSAVNKPGNAEFHFNPALHGGRLRALFDAKWRLAEASDGYTIFDVNPAGGSVKMVFSPAQKSDDEAYVVIIGDEKNTKTRLTKGGKDLLVIDGAQSADAIFGDLTKPHSFWAKIDEKIFTMGKGREVGKNEFLHYEEKDSESALVSFVGFAGSETALFTNIVVSSKEFFAKIKADADAAAQAAKDKEAAAAKASKDKADADAKAAKEKAEIAAKVTQNVAAKDDKKEYKAARKHHHKRHNKKNAGKKDKKAKKHANKKQKISAIAQNEDAETSEKNDEKED